VDFVAADNPHANKITIRILAAVAEHEREMISRRIKEALAVKKAQLAKVGKKLGNPRAAEALKLARAAQRQAQPPEAVLQMMARWRAERSLWQIADELNQLGIRTGRGSRWYASSVSLQLQALAKRQHQAPAPPQHTRPPLGPDEIPLTALAGRTEAAKHQPATPPKRPAPVPDFATWLDQRPAKRQAARGTDANK
jgi:hypothetical protein